VVNGPRIDNRRYNTMTLVGPKLIVFGGSAGWNNTTCLSNLNDIWALDLNNGTLPHTPLSHFDHIFQQ
jgi:Kelch motif